MEFKDIIKKRRLELGMTLEEVAKQVGVGRATVQRWESGVIVNVRRDKIVKIAAALKTTPGYLMGWKDDPDSEPLENLYDNITPYTPTKVPLLGTIACGEPIYADEENGQFIEANIKADFCLRAKGDSMINARINDGDIVFIKKQNVVENGEIAAIIIEDEATLKRVYYYPGENKMSLVAENTKYAPLIYVGTELSTIKILGKAVAFQSEIK